MSASERLKGLDGQWPQTDATLRRALPQIVAVVEAAEAVRRSEPMTNVDTIPVATMASLRQIASDSLTALEKALA